MVMQRATWYCPECDWRGLRTVNCPRCLTVTRRLSLFRWAWMHALGYFW